MITQKPKIEVTNQAEYSRAKSGVSQQVILVAVTVEGVLASLSSPVVLGRMLSFAWNESYNVEPLLELDRTEVKETIDGAANLGQANFNTWETTENNNNLPTTRNRPEMIAVEIEGGSELNKGEIINFFLGVKITNQGKNVQGSGGGRMRNGTAIFTRRLSAAEFLNEFATTKVNQSFKIGS